MTTETSDFEQNLRCFHCNKTPVNYLSEFLNVPFKLVSQQHNIMLTGIAAIVRILCPAITIPC